MPGGIWGQQVRDQSSGFGGFSQPRPASAFDNANVLLRGGGSSSYGGRGDTSVQKRQFADVGKANINLLDPLAQSRAAVNYQPVDGADGGLLGLGNYYNPMQPGGLFAGLFGGIAQTLGGVFGEGGAKTGSDVGTFLGKTLEMPLAAVGSVGVPFVAPVIDGVNSEIEKVTPYILRDTLKIPTNVGGAFQSLLNIFGLAGMAIERTYAGMDARGALPPDIEERVEKGELTRDEGFDEMVLTSRGYSNDVLHNLGWNLLLDPANWVSLGVGTVGGAVRGTGVIARTFSSAVRAEPALAQAAIAQGGRLAELTQAAQRSEAITGMVDSRGLMNQMRSVIDDSSARYRLSYIERLGMSALGPVSENVANPVLKVGNYILRATDPVNFFSGSKAGQRSMELISVAASTGVIAAYKPMVVLRIANLADKIVDGGSDRVYRTVGVNGGNALQEYGLSDLAADAMKSGAVPQTGTLTPPEAVREILRGGGYDTNVGKYIELLVERNKDISVGMLPPEEMLEQSILKFAALHGVDSQQVRAVMKEVSQDEAIFIHALYYYRKGEVLHTDVLKALREAKAAGSLPAHIDPELIAVVSPRTLTDLTIKDVDDAMASGSIADLRKAVEKYDSFNWVNTKNVPDADLRAAVENWLEVNRPHVIKETPLVDAAGNPLLGLPKELEDWAADSGTFGYKLGQKVPGEAGPDAMWRVTRAPGDHGDILNANPYSDFVVEGGDSVKRLNTFTAAKMAAFRSVRQERIVWAQRRRFITDFAKGSENGGIDLPPALADRIWKALMYEAKDRYIQPRGMEPQEMYRTARRVLDDARKENAQYSNLATRLTERQVVLTLLRATNGDVGLVGVTQKVTGTVKAFAPGSGANYWGRISERLYPLMRFTLNPIFQAMELMEPYVLNSMRGIWTPLYRDGEKFQESLATSNAIFQLIRHSDDPDGIAAETAEALATQAYTGAQAAQHFGRGRIARWMPHIGERKAVAAAAETKRIMGDHFYKAFKEILGDKFEAYWADREWDFGTTNRGEIAARWVAGTFALQDVNGFQVATIDDILKMRNIGKRFRLNKNGDRGAYTFADVEVVLDHARSYAGGAARRSDRGMAPGEALLEDLKNMSRQEWADEIEASGLNADNTVRVSQQSANDVWNMANGPELDEFWNGRKAPGGGRVPNTGYRGTYLQGVTGSDGPWTRFARDQEIAAVRAIVRAFAEGKGMTEEEFVKLHFETLPEYLNAYSVTNGITYTEIREGWGADVLRRSPNSVPPAEAWNIVMAGGAGFAERIGSAHPLYHHLEETEAAAEHYFQKLNGGNYRDFQSAQMGDTYSFYDIPNKGYTNVTTLMQDIRPADVIVRIRKDKVIEDGYWGEGVDLLERRHIDTNNWEVLTDEGWVPFAGPGGRIEPGGPVDKVADQQSLRVTTRMTTLPVRGTNAEIQTGRELYGFDPSDPLGKQGSGIHKVDIDEVLLTDPEKKARGFYTGAGYDDLNPWLRGDEPDFPVLTEQERRDYRDWLDRAILKSVLGEPMRVYRGIDLTEAEGSNVPDFENMQVGDTFSDPAFFSMSGEESRTHSFAGFHSWSGEDHVAAILKVDLPPGFNVALILGSEDEYIGGRNILWEVIKTEITEHGSRGRAVRHTIAPASHQTLPGVRRLAIGEASPELANEGRLLSDAMHDPAAARRQIPKVGDVGPSGIPYTEDDVFNIASDVELVIAKAEAAKPAIGAAQVGPHRFGRRTTLEGLTEITDTLSTDEIIVAGDALPDFRGRARHVTESEVYADSTSGDHHATVRVANGLSEVGLIAATAEGIVEHGGFRFGLRRALRVWERMALRGPAAVTDAGVPAVEKDMGVAFTRGAAYGHPTGILNNRRNDTQDALLGNTSRRQTGRSDTMQPVVSDSLTAEFVGYFTQDAADDLTSQDLLYMGQPRATAAGPVGHVFGAWEDARRWSDDVGFTIPHDQLTPAQTSMVYRYTGTGSGVINHNGEAIPELDELMQPIPEAVTVTRGVRYADSFPGLDLATVRVGHDLVAPYYLSTSMARASAWNMPYRLEVTVNEGTPAFFADPHSSVQGEAELIIAREEPLRVTRISNDNGVKVIHATTKPRIPQVTESGAAVAPTPVRAQPPLEFTPGSPDEITHIPGNDIPVGAPHGESIRGTFDEPPPTGVTGAGVVIQEADGRVWIYEPKNHYGGYEHSFPKGGPDAGEDFRDAAMREAMEEVGFSVELTGFLGDFDNVQGTSRSRFYTAKRTGGGPALGNTDETWTVKLVTPEDARRLLIHDDIPDARDQAILEKAIAGAQPEAVAAAPRAAKPGLTEALNNVMQGGSTVPQYQMKATVRGYLVESGLQKRGHADFVGEPNGFKMVYNAADSEWYAFAFDETGQPVAAVMLEGKSGVPTDIVGLTSVKGGVGAQSGGTRTKGYASKLYDWIQDETDVNLYPLTGIETTPQGYAFSKRWLQHRQELEAGVPLAGPAPIPHGELDYVQDLGGTTGATQMRDPATGKLYVDKMGDSPEHVTEEFTADSVYEAAGVPVAHAELVGEGNNLTKRAEMIEGGVDLDKFWATAPNAEVEAVKRQLQQGFALDALLANWDVIGLVGDNIVVKDGVPYRIDNGGALRLRAAGQPKSTTVPVQSLTAPLGGMWGPKVDELTKMRIGGNQWQKRIFGDLTDEDIARQVADLEAKMPAILAALPEELRPIVQQRYDDMVSQMQGVLPTARPGEGFAPTTMPPMVAFDAPAPTGAAIPTRHLEPTNTRLGGSTGATQVIDPTTGKKYVDKYGANSGHVREESTTDRVYESLGIEVAPHTLIEQPNGLPMKRAEMIESAETLSEFIDHASDADIEKIFAKLREGFAVDALLGNWDVIGMTGDNIIIKNGVPIRIDNGGALRYRAQGGLKDPSHFTEHVVEIQSMRYDSYRAEWASRVFEDLTDPELRRQVLDLGPKMETILANLPPELRAKIAARYQSMVEQTDHIHPAPPKVVAAPAAAVGEALEVVAPTVPGRTGPLVPTKIGEYEHEYMVGWLNELADLANQRGLAGRSNWNAADIAQVGAAARETLGRRGGRAVSAAEFERASSDIDVPMYPEILPGTTVEDMKLAPLFEVLQQRRYRTERIKVMRAASVTLHKQLRDVLGLIIESSDEMGVGLFESGDGVSALMSTHILGSAENLQSVLDVIAYVTGQRVVRAFKQGPNIRDIDDFSAYKARMSLTIEPGHLSPRMAEKFAELLGRTWPEAGNMVATKTANGGWVLTVIDDTGELLPRLADGSVDEDQLLAFLKSMIHGEVGQPQWGLPEGAKVELATDYGQLLTANPPKLPDGSVDWDGYAGYITASSQERGVAIGSADLRSIRTTYHDTFHREVRNAAPNQSARLDRDEPLQGNVLEDRRGGDVLGTTSPQASGAAVLRGFASADALTGLHELVHVFSIGAADPSMRDVISKAWDEYNITNDAAKQAKIADLQSRLATAPNRSVHNRYQNQITALQYDLQNPHPTEWGHAQEEFFVQLVFDWIQRGVPGNSELGNAFEHFRNWITVTKGELSKPGLAPLVVSPQMDAFLARMFKRKGVDTVSYSVEQQTLRMAALHMTRGAWDEAHGTHYYKKDRSMAERSINHPYIGLYPASYMWGKVLPEMIRFLALRPFGMETPFLAWNVAREVSNSVTAQGELDPGFKEWLNGNEDAFMLFSMLFPGLPHDIPANASLPVRRIAEQGLEAQRQYAMGVNPEAVKDIDYGKGAQDAIQYALGPLGAIRTSSEVISMGGNFARSVLGETIAKPTEPSETLPLR